MIQERAATIIYTIHKSMNWDVWGKKRLKYWGVLTDNIRSAAYTNKLSKFVNALCSKMQVPQLGRNEAQRKEVEAALNGLSMQDEKALLKLFREEATTLVLECRVFIEEHRALFETVEEVEEFESENGNGLSV